jgi:hypothetical protein
MNSGFITYFTKGKVLNSVGTHQKFDKVAYRLIRPRVSSTKFPSRAQILKFEGMGGPDGLKMKSKKYRADHLWDPVNKIGNLPDWADVHYKNAVEALRAKDMIKASFELGFMAHYLTDSLTPAHHTNHKLITAQYEDASKLKKNWVVWGRKGLVSSHMMFEGGVSTAIAFNKLRVNFDEEMYQRILSGGIKNVIEDESLRIAKLNLFDKYLKKGWTVGLAKTVKTVVVKRIPQLVAAAWLAAYTEAGNTPKVPVPKAKRNQHVKN